MLHWKTLVTIVALAPFVALLGGAGFLFYQIGQRWDARGTDSLIVCLVATCGGGTVVIGVLLAIIIGVPFAIRMLCEAGQAERMWRQLPSEPLYPPRLLPRAHRHPGHRNHRSLPQNKGRGSVRIRSMTSGKMIHSSKSRINDKLRL